MSRCPKCGHDNPADTLFCEECDWRLDQVYRPEKKRNPLMFSGIAIIIGAIAAALAFMDGTAVYGAVVGAVGMVLSGYSVNLPRYIAGANKSLCMALSGVAIVLSVIGFLMGLAAYAGAVA